MVQVRQSPAFQRTAPDDLNPWLDKIVAGGSYGEHTKSLLLDAAQAVRAVETTVPETYDTGEPRVSCLLTGMQMAEILAELGVDDQGLQASVLYRAVREQKMSLTDVARQFGKGVADLIGNVRRMAVIGELRSDAQTGALGQDPGYQAAKVREMLVSIIDDVRVALLKLAERTCAIRAVKGASDSKRKRVAAEIFDVYAPLAHRLGIGHLKWELEDLAFRYMETDEYTQIARLLAEKRSDRQDYINEMIATIDEELRKLGKLGEVTGRAKHIYSIWRKMHRKGVGFSQIYDIRAVRVLVPSVSDCYAVLGIVHSKWRNIPNEFDDYIAAPKENGYRSLHTAVIGPGRKVIEIQIRTFDMHEEAEFGICAHWEYKEDGKDASRRYEEKIAWLRQVLDWHDDIGEQTVGDFLRLEGSADRVYVFTPKGHVLDLPKGATPVDFAYHVHTEIGHRCKGAKVNGAVVPLNYVLQTADQVDIITGRFSCPNRQWLNHSLAYVATARAKNRVQQWFKSQDREQNLAAGKAMFSEELNRLGMRARLSDKVIAQFNCADGDDAYVKIGAGDLDLGRVIRAIQTDTLRARALPQTKSANVARFAHTQHYIYGVGELSTRIANCCTPQPGESICGYRTRRKSVTVHREDCGNMLRLQALAPHKTLQLSWGRKPDTSYLARLVIKSYDRSGLLRDITAVIDEQDMFIRALNTGTVTQGVVQLELTTEISGIEQLSKLLARIRQIPNVVDVWRVAEQE